MSVQLISQAIENYNKLKGYPQDQVSVKNDILELLAAMVERKAALADLEEVKDLLQANTIFAPYQAEIVSEVVEKISRQMNFDNQYYVVETGEGRRQYGLDQQYFSAVLDLFALPALEQNADYLEMKALFESNKAKIQEIMQKANKASHQKALKAEFIPGEFDQYKALLVETGLFRFQKNAQGEEEFVTEPLLTEGNEGILRAPLFQVYLHLWERSVGPSYLSKWAVDGALTGRLPPYQKMRQYIQSPPENIRTLLSSLSTIGFQLNTLRPLFEVLAKARGIKDTQQHGGQAWSHAFPLEFSGSSLALVQTVRSVLRPSELDKYRGLLDLPSESSFTAIIAKLKKLSEQYQLLEVELNLSAEAANNPIFVQAQSRAPQVLKLFDYLEATHCLEYVTDEANLLRVCQSESALANDLGKLLVNSTLSKSELKTLRIFVEAIPEKRDEVLSLSYQRNLETELVNLPSVLEKTNQVWESIDARMKVSVSAASNSRRTRAFKAPLSFLSLDELTPIASDPNLLAWPEIKPIGELSVEVKKTANTLS